jgi:hypothetical protein
VSRLPITEAARRPQEGTIHQEDAGQQEEASAGQQEEASAGQQEEASAGQQEEASAPQEGKEHQESRAAGIRAGEASAQGPILELPDGTRYTMPLQVMFAKRGHAAIHHLLSAADLTEKEAALVDILRWKATTS